jgi:hypothetical protein
MLKIGRELHMLKTAKNWYLLYVFALLSVLLGCQARSCELESYDPNEEIVSSEAAVTPEYIFYQKTFRAVTDKTLRDEDLDHLNLIAFARFGQKPDYYIYDFEYGLVFNVSDIGMLKTDKSIMIADETLKNDIISKLEELNAEDWWGVTYDENSIELQNWFDESDYGDSWYLWLKFDNGEVISLRGAGYDATVYGTAELNEFHQYIRSLAVSD